MENKKRFSRRDFLRVSALTAAGAVLAGCCPSEPKTVTEKETVVVKETEEVTVKETEEVMVTEEAPEAEPVTLEIRNSNPEYENGEQQIWDIYLADNPHVTIEFFSVSEGASVETYNAKVAGGWVPAMDWWVRADNTNYQEYLNQIETGFPWFDNFTYDIRNAFKDRLRA